MCHASPRGFLTRIGVSCAMTWRASPHCRARRVIPGHRRVVSEHCVKPPNGLAEYSSLAVSKHNRGSNRSQVLARQRKSNHRPRVCKANHWFAIGTITQSIPSNGGQLSFEAELPESTPPINEQPDASLPQVPTPASEPESSLAPTTICAPPVPAPPTLDWLPPVDMPPVADATAVLLFMVELAEPPVPFSLTEYPGPTWLGIGLPGPELPVLPGGSGCGFNEQPISTAAAAVVQYPRDQVNRRISFEIV